MSEIEKLFEATKPFREEIAKLQAEVELCHKNLKMFRDSLANVGEQRDAAKEIAESANLQIGALRNKMGQIRNLLCAPGPGTETPTKNVDAAWKIAAASSGAVGTSEKHKTSDSRHTVDHRQLLLKYLEHVEDCEGVTFIHNIGGSDVAFSDEEVAELYAIDKEYKKKS